MEYRKKDTTQKVYKDYDIFPGKVRLVREGQQPIVIDRDAAIDLARQEGKNLVQIAYSKNDFPKAVCKILDYGKHLYEQKQREKQAKKQARANEAEVKTVQFSIMTDDNDKLRQISHAKEFLAEGEKVKLSIRFRNRCESAKLDYAKSVMKEILTHFDGIAALDSAPAVSGREMSCILRSVKK